MIPPPPSSTPRPNAGDVARFQAITWGFFLLIDLLMLSTFERITLPKVANVTLGLLLAAFASQGIWQAVTRLGFPDANQMPVRLLVPALCVGGGAAIGFVMQPIERWAKSSPHLPTDLPTDLPPASFGGLWLFYALMLALWSVFAAAFFFYDRSRRIEIERAQFAIAAKEAEAQALRWQVNPHFLFNSFATLRALIDIDPERAREAINQLSGMMRYSLATTRQPTVRLADELEMVRQFIAMESLRLGPRLRFSLTTDPELDTLRVPPMSVQTLVENAVKFGIADRRSGGEVRVTVARTEAAVEITVTNPGRIRSTSDSTGIGLRNLQHRLSHLYGPAASIALTQAHPDEVQAILQIPFPPANLTPSHAATSHSARR